MIDVLLANALVYIFTFFYAFYKARKLNIYVFIWLAYSIVTLMGYFCVKWDMYYIKDANLGYKLSPLPYILAYMTTLLLTHPLKKYKRFYFDVSLLNSKHVYYLSFIIALVLIFQTVINGIRAYVIFNLGGFGEAYMMSHEGESISVLDSQLLNRLFHISSVITHGFTALYAVYYLHRILKSKDSKMLNYFLFVLAFLPDIMLAFATGSKGGLFFIFFSLLFYYLLFQSYFSKKVNRHFLMIGGVIGVIFLISVMSIIVGRIENKTGYKADELQTSTHIVHYLGESYPNLGVFYYKRVKAHPNGRRFFPEFFDNNAEEYYKKNGLSQKFNYWERKTKVNMALFKTFWGDWYVEFGLLGSIVGIIIIYIAFKSLCFDSTIWTLSRLPLICFYYNRILIRGCFSGNGIEGSEIHKSLIFILAITFIIRHFERTGRLTLQKRIHIQEQR